METGKIKKFPCKIVGPRATPKK